MAEVAAGAGGLLTDDAALVPMINRMATVVVSPQVGNVINRDGFGPLLDRCG